MSRARERADVLAAIETHAAAIERSRAAGRIQPHSRQLPTEAEMAEAAFAAQQLRVVARDITQGLHEGAADALADQESAA